MIAMPTTMGGASKARTDDKPGMSKPQYRRRFVRQVCILIGLQAWTDDSLWLCALRDLGLCPT